MAGPGNDKARDDTAQKLARGVGRLLTHLGYDSLTEFTLRSGRRADLAGIDRKGRIAIVEIKSSVADFRADQKWPEYLDYCDLFYFAVPAKWLEFFTGFFLLGYLAYEYVHFAIHQSQPRSRLIQHLRRHHLTHHAHSHEGNSGVSTPLWDIIFLTTLQTNTNQPREGEAPAELL